MIGERLFDPHLWRPSRRGVAGGLAIGLFIALTPTLGVQMVLAALAAYFLRVNIPIAVLACWITNPLTAPVIYPLQYRLGLWLGGPVQAEELYNGALQNFISYIRPLWVGSLASGIFFSAIGYMVAFLGWTWIAKIRSGMPSRLPAKEGSELHPPFE